MTCVCESTVIVVRRLLADLRPTPAPASDVTFPVLLAGYHHRHRLPWQHSVAKLFVSVIFVFLGSVGRVSGQSATSTVSPSQTISPAARWVLRTIAGTQGVSGNVASGVAATSASIGPAVYGDFNASTRMLYWADSGSNVVRALNTTSGIMTTVPISGMITPYGLALVSAAGGNGIALGELSAGDVKYVAAGSSTFSVVFSSSTSMENIQSDGAGGFYAAHDGSNCIRRLVPPSWTSTTVAGVCSTTAGFVDNIAATSARMDSPHDVAADEDGGLYIAVRV